MKRINVPGSMIDGMKRVNIILTYGDRKGIRGYTLNKDGYYYDVIFDKISSFNENSDVLRELELFARVVSYRTSSDIHGMRQRKHEVLDSVLKVMAFNRSKKIDNDVYVLETGRRDGTYLNFVRSDLEFIYPTINSEEKMYNSIIKGDLVIAIKDDNCDMFRKGDLFTVVSAAPESQEYGGDVLFLKNEEKEIVSFTSNFKIKRK